MWQAHKAERVAAGNLDIIHSWPYLQQCCLDNCCLHDYKQRAVEKLTSLKQTGFVADYKALFGSLVAQTTLPMEARLFFWNQGLKPAVADACYLDPLTHSAYKDIGQAQKADLAADSRFYATAANAKKRGQPSSGQSLAAFQPQAKTTHYVV